MPTNLEEKFRSFCNLKNLEINKNQITTIQILEDFYNKNFNSSIFEFFKKKKSQKRILPLRRCWCWKNDDLGFFLRSYFKKKT